MPKKKTITIRDDQAEWVERKYINLSRFVQAKIDEEMQSEGKKGNSS